MFKIQIKITDMPDVIRFFNTKYSGTKFLVDDRENSLVTIEVYHEDTEAILEDLMDEFDNIDIEVIVEN